MLRYSFIGLRIEMLPTSFMSATRLFLFDGAKLQRYFILPKEFEGIGVNWNYGVTNGVNISLYIIYNV